METFPKVVGMLVQWKIFPVSKLVKYCTSKQLSPTYEKSEIPKTEKNARGKKCPSKKRCPKMGMNENMKHTYLIFVIFYSTAI